MCGNRAIREQAVSCFACFKAIPLFHHFALRCSWLDTWIDRFEQVLVQHEYDVCTVCITYEYTRTHMNTHLKLSWNRLLHLASQIRSFQPEGSFQYRSMCNASSQIGSTLWPNVSFPIFAGLCCSVCRGATEQPRVFSLKTSGLSDFRSEGSSLSIGRRYPPAISRSESLQVMYCWINSVDSYRLMWISFSV